MKQSQFRILIYGISNKLKRGENLEDILKGYTKLTNEDKEEIKKALAPTME